MSITYKLKVPRGQQIKINKAFVIQELMNIDGKVFFHNCSHLKLLQILLRMDNFNFQRAAPG